MSSLLDFDGDYGRQYNERIRTLIPAYEANLEIAAAALAALTPSARTALVVGPGSGMELPGILQALPDAQLTLVEPSEQMRAFCSAVIEKLAAGGRVQWGPEDLSSWDDGPERLFDAVISHNVLHVLAPQHQRQLLRQLAARLAPGGALLVSSYSEGPALDFELGLNIARARFRACGMDEATLEAVMASRNTKVFALDPQQLAQELVAAGLEPPIPLLQALFNGLWLSRRPACPDAAQP